MGPQEPEEAMRRPLAFALGWIALLAGPAAAQQLDWEVEEQPAGPVLSWVRGARDGSLGLLDCAADLQLGAFSELALVSGALLMGASDLVGLVDDNPLTQHVFKGVASKSLAKTAYLFHLAGGEAILGSHGLEVEWYLQRELAELNPLLAGEDSAPPLPLEPLAFVEDGILHKDVYGAHLPGSILLASALADGLLRPAGNVVRIAGAHAAAERIEVFANGLVRRAVE
jgi:hypothetical protein